MTFKEQLQNAITNVKCMKTTAEIELGDIATRQIVLETRIISYDAQALVLHNLLKYYEEEKESD